jgi:hypothetical protein
MTKSSNSLKTFYYSTYFLNCVFELRFITLEFGSKICLLLGSRKILKVHKGA